MGWDLGVAYRSNAKVYRELATIVAYRKALNFLFFKSVLTFKLCSVIIEKTNQGVLIMKTVKDKYLVVGADFAGFPLKEVVVEHLTKKGWKILDLGVKKDSDPNDTDLMFHRVGLRVGAEISEGNYERAMIFCGTGMGIHIAASKCPGVHAGVVESLPAAQRAITGNGVNVLALGAFYVAPQTACDIADAYLSNELGSGWEWWHNFYEFHKLAIDELNAFNYEEYKKNGFKVNKLGDYDLTLDFDKKPE